MNIARRTQLVVMQVYILPLLRGLVEALSVAQPVKYFVANQPARKVFELFAAEWSAVFGQHVDDSVCDAAGPQAGSAKDDPRFGCASRAGRKVDEHVWCRI